MIDWLNDNSGAVQAVAVVVLAVVTYFYMRSTGRMAKAAEEQAKASATMATQMEEQRLDADRPYLLIEAFDLDRLEWKHLSPEGAPDPHTAFPKSVMCRVHNAGHGPAKEVMITAFQELVAFDVAKKDFLGPGDSHQVTLKASEFASAFYEDGVPTFRDWAEKQSVQISSENGYDCAILAFCTDIHDRPWSTYLRLGMAATTDNVKKVVDKRELIPIEHRIVQLAGHS
ncbi:MAG TPA: hypothetical protein VI759_09705 [Dehalococcoidia bacterium]|nr:hypothetical protein [Dehalococcoidia bacterium]